MADEPVGTVYAKVKPDVDGFGKELAEGADGEVEKNKGLFGGVGAKVGTLIGGAFAAGKIFDIGKAAFGAAEESAKIGKQTEAVIKSTGSAAGVSADQIGDLSEAISKKTGVDDEAIQSGANLLLTFTNIKNGVAAGDKVFDRATKTLVDMGAALGTDVSSSAVQLGKALNDPIAGISALSRVGVTFTDQQKEQIKTMVEAGNVAGAQGVILDELGKEFGGSAEAQATASDKAKVAVGNLQESIGGLLVPAVNSFAGVMNDKVLPAVQSTVDWFDRHKTVAYILGGVIGTLAIGYGLYTAAQVASTVATGAWSAATGVATAGQWLLNAALSANPIGLVVVAIGLLVGALVVAYNKVDWFHDAIDAVGRGIASFFGWVSDHWPLLLAILTGPFGLAVLFITEHWDGIVDFVTGLPGRLASAGSRMWDWIGDAFKGAINVVLRAWNSIAFETPSFDMGPVHVGGKRIGVPTVPLLADGGVAFTPTLVGVGEYPGARSNPEIIAPQRVMLDTFTQALNDWSGGSDGGFHVGTIVAADPRDAIDKFENMFWQARAAGELTMAIEPTQNQVADLLRRVGRLESAQEAAATSPRLKRSSIDDGRLVVRDAAGNDRVTLGNLGDSDYGFRIADVDGAVVFEVTEDGWAAPYWPVVLAPNPAAIQGDRCRAGTDSGSYTELWRSDFFAVSSTIYFDFAQYPNGGNMDWRIQVYEYIPIVFTIGTPQTVVSYTGQTANDQKAGSFDLPSAGLIAGSGNVKGKFWTMRVSARMNSGTRVDLGVNAMPFFAPS